MKRVPAYFCEKCGYHAFGEKNALIIQAHERIPVTAICDSLDGLIIKDRFKNNCVVFRQMPLVSRNHEALYSWDTYGMPGFKQRIALSKDIQEKFDRVLGFNGFTAANIVDTVLYETEDKNRYKQYDEFSKKEFKRVAARLKQMHPALYANARFKRELKYRHQSRNKK